MAGETTPSTASATAHSDALATQLRAQLSCRYYRPGGIVRGFVQLQTQRATADASTEIASVVAQIHAHVSVDSNLLSVPVNLASPRASPPPSDFAEGIAPVDVSKFSGDTGSCLYLSAPCVLLSDLNIAPTASESREDTLRRCRRDFAIVLPENPCPSFRGVSARVFYVLSITANPLTSNPVAVHLPFDVYASDYSFAPESIAGAQDPAKRRGSRKERSVSLVMAPVGVRKGSEIPFELRPSLMHGRVETEQLQRAQTSLFTIGKDDSHLVKLLLTKQFYHPGDVLLGVFDFSRASIPCVEIHATLCQEEVLASMALQPSKVVQSKVVGTFHEYTASALQTNVRFSIPHDALPTIKTDLVCFQWCIRFEFSANVTATDATAAAASPTTQIFRWHVPIDVRPSVSRESSSFTNVPHRLFSGSSRSAALLV